MKKFLRIVVGLSAVVAASRPASGASIPAFTTTDTTGGLNISTSQTLGWKFSTSEIIAVTSLGIFDDGGNGLINDHAVGIYDTAGLLLVSTTVTAGVGEPLANGFRYQSITPFVLNPGTYFLGGFMPGNPGGGTDKALGAANNFTPAPWITYLNPPGGLFGNSTLALSDPDPLHGGSVGGFLNPGYFGPNFMSEVVPEPGTMLLLGSGLIGIAAAIRRRRA